MFDARLQIIFNKVHHFTSNWRTDKFHICFVEHNTKESSIIFINSKNF